MNNAANLQEIRQIESVLAAYRQSWVSYDREDVRRLKSRLGELYAVTTVRCGHCGGEHLADRSCDCFDNNCQ